jgi:hypothetical protein
MENKLHLKDMFQTARITSKKVKDKDKLCMPGSLTTSP